MGVVVTFVNIVSSGVIVKNQRNGRLAEAQHTTIIDIDLPYRKTITGGFWFSWIRIKYTHKKKTCSNKFLLKRCLVHGWRCHVCFLWMYVLCRILAEVYIVRTTCKLQLVAEHDNEDKVEELSERYYKQFG